MPGLPNLSKLTMLNKISQITHFSEKRSHLTFIHKIYFEMSLITPGLTCSYLFCYMVMPFRALKQCTSWEPLIYAIHKKKVFWQTRTNKCAS